MEILTIVERMALRSKLQQNLRARSELVVAPAVAIVVVAPVATVIVAVVAVVTTTVKAAVAAIHMAMKKVAVAVSLEVLKKSLAVETLVLKLGLHSLSERGLQVEFAGV